MIGPDLADTAARLTAAGFRCTARTLARLLLDGQTAPDADLTALVTRLRQSRQQRRRARRAARRSA